MFDLSETVTIMKTKLIELVYCKKNNNNNK